MKNKFRGLLKPLRHALATSPLSSFILILAWRYRHGRAHDDWFAGVQLASNLLGSLGRLNKPEFEVFNG
jgi:hypothetical protein